MTRPVGEVFTFFDHKYVVVEDGKDGYKTACALCELHCKPCALFRSITGSCEGYLRTDGKDVHFEKFGVDF